MFRGLRPRAPLWGFRPTPHFEVFRQTEALVSLPMHHICIGSSSFTHNP